MLPFRNLSDDPENQYFADGIMEDILNHLFKIRELNVRSRTTAEHFRENQMSSPQIARELRVNYVVEGSVFREDNKVRIFIQLIDARNGWYQPYNEGILKAKKFSAKALELDPDCAEAHLVKGVYLIWPEREWEEGSKELLVSIQLNPNSGYAHQAYAQLLMITGPIEEARIHMDRVIELEPYFWVMHNLNAWIYYFEGRHREAVEACKTAHDLKQDFIFNNWLFFLNYAKLGEGEKAAAELQTIAKSNPASVKFTDEIMDAYNMSGINGLFKWLTDINVNRPVPAVGMSGQPFFTAWWFAILGDREKSLYWLERNMQSQIRNYSFFNLIATNPDFDILRDDPRFLKIIDEIGLTHYNTRKAK